MDPFEPNRHDRTTSELCRGHQFRQLLGATVAARTDHQLVKAYLWERCFSAAAIAQHIKTIGRWVAATSPQGHDLSLTGLCWGELRPMQADLSRFIAFGVPQDRARLIRRVLFQRGHQAGLRLSSASAGCRLLAGPTSPERIGSAAKDVDFPVMAVRDVGTAPVSATTQEAMPLSLS